jgi:hypothetical protein
MEDIKHFGADNTEVVWFAELTEGMVGHLGADDLAELIDALSEAVASICDDYEVEG